MAHPNLAHRRTHNLLLMSKLLNQRDNISPITLILDTLEQTAKPLIQEYLRRARMSKSNTIFLSFETPRPPRNVTNFTPCWDKSPGQVLQDVKQILASSSSLATSTTNTQRFIIVVDSLQAIASHSGQDLTLNFPAYLSSFILPDPRHPKRQVSMVAVYHTEIPCQTLNNEYAPSPLAQLAYLATSIMTLHPLAHLLAEKAARDRSQAPPVFGLAEELEGVIIGLNPRDKTMEPEARGLAIELEHRRKSGRTVVDWFFLPSRLPKQSTLKDTFREHVTLLADHPLIQFEQNDDVMDTSDEELSGLTFDLGLTERQKQERNGVVLPYFDAQKAGGGEGGRILYSLGTEDDFDDEEDED